MRMSIHGIAAFDQRLQRLKDRVQKKLIRNAMTAGLRIVAKAIKKELPSKWKAGRKGIGQSVKNDKTGVVVGKAGVGAGIKRKRSAKITAEAKFNRSGKKKGVGLGVANIHWFLMGTENRYTGAKSGTTSVNGIRTKTMRATGNARQFTGRLKKTPIVQRAFRSSKREAVKVIQANIKAAIDRELAKL